MTHHTWHSAPSDSLPKTRVNFFFQNSFAAPCRSTALARRWMRVGACSSFCAGARRRRTVLQRKCAQDKALQQTVNAQARTAI